MSLYIQKKQPHTCTCSWDMTGKPFYSTLGIPDGASALQLIYMYKVIVYV